MASLIAAGMLVLTRGDGTVREAGIVVGRDGKDGATIDDFAAMLAPIKAELAKRAARPEPQPGRDGQPGLPGRDGAPGKDGADGLGFDDLQMTYDGERKFTFRFVRGERSRSSTSPSPLAIYREVFKEGTAYVTGDQVSFGGSIWHCLEPNTAKPGQGNPRMAPRPASMVEMATMEGRLIEVAVDAGFRGSETDWLKTLKGPPGPPGKDLRHLVMTTDAVDELLCEAEAKFDRMIVELAVEEGNRLLAAGATVDDLPRLMAAVHRSRATVAG